MPRWLKVGRSRRRDASVVGRRSRRRQVAAGTPGRAVGRVLAANRASAVLRGSSPLSHGPAWAGRWRAEARASCRADERLSVAWRASLLASGFADGCRLREPGPGSCRCDSVRRRGGSGYPLPLLAPGPPQPARDPAAASAPLLERSPRPFRARHASPSLACGPGVVTTG